jgi:hypothetical protein
VPWLVQPPPPFSRSRPHPTVNYQRKQRLPRPGCLECLEIPSRCLWCSLGNVVSLVPSWRVIVVLVVLCVGASRNHERLYRVQEGKPQVTYWPRCGAAHNQNTHRDRPYTILCLRTRSHTHKRNAYRNTRIYYARPISGMKRLSVPADRKNGRKKRCI